MRLAALTTVLLCWLCLFLAVGHGLHWVGVEEEHDSMAGEAAAICLVLFTVVVPLALAAFWGRQRICHAVEPVRAMTAGRVVLQRQVPSARASPALLQRFLN